MHILQISYQYLIFLTFWLAHSIIELYIIAFYTIQNTGDIL